MKPIEAPFFRASDDGAAGKAGLKLGSGAFGFAGSDGCAAAMELCEDGLLRPGGGGKEDMVLFC